MLYSLKLVAALLAGTNALAPHIWEPETGDDVNTHKTVCGVYGDPHIQQSDGTTNNYMGVGEFQLVAIPSMPGTPEVHYWGCGLSPIGNAASVAGQGSYVGAIAVRIGNKDIEIVANDLWVVGGAEYWATFGEEDRPVGPFTLDAAGTTVTIVREAITAAKIQKSQWNDNEALAHGHMLYRWSVSTEEGFVLHSHAVKVPAAQGGWVLDVHINYPDDTPNVKGLCLDDCDEACSKPSCLPINSSATYGISRIFSDKAQGVLKAACPVFESSSCPGRSPTHIEACENSKTETGKSLGDAQIACVHLSNAADVSLYEACMFDYCMGSAIDGVQEWYEEHTPPEPIKCKIVADPHVTSYNSFKFDFAANGTFNVLEKKAAGPDDPCDISIQNFECMAACPSSLCGNSYMHALGIKVPGGTTSHEIILSGSTCTLDGVACGTKQDHNNGADGVKLVPYTPISGTNENMGDYGPGYTGWFVYAGGFAVNVTVTKMGDDGPDMMNLMVATPPMCTNKATGLCSTTSTTESSQIQKWAKTYQERQLQRKAKGKGDINALAPQDVPAMTDESISNDVVPAAIFEGLKTFTCPVVP